MCFTSAFTLLGIFPWWVEFPTELQRTMKQKDVAEQLSQMHADMAHLFSMKLASGEITTAELNVARQFLKDNQITATATEGSAVDDLAKALPDIDKVVAFKRKSA